MLAGIHTFWGIQNLENCNNGRDDDRDGWVDAADPDCPCSHPGGGASFDTQEHAQYRGNVDCEEVYRLTNRGAKRMGRITLYEQVDLNDTLDLTFRLQLGKHDRGGLGVWIVLEDATEGGARLSPGHSHQGPPNGTRTAPSVAIEVDTDDDGGSYEMADDHLSLFLDGAYQQPTMGPISLRQNVEDGQDHFLRLNWDPAQQELRVYFDNLQKPALVYSSDLVAGVFGGQSAVSLSALGFTGRGNNTNEQRIQVMNLTYQAAPSGTFPVEWLGFDVAPRGTGNLLTWSTASETNSSHFVVERSPDRQGYQPIGRIDAAGHATHVSRYHFRDEALPRSDRLYYRLRQVDLDGSSHYSQVVEWVAPQPSKGLTLRAFPNPAQDRFTLGLDGQGPHDIRVLTPQGQTVLQVQHHLQGPTQLAVDAAQWAPGLYLVQVSGPQGQASAGIWVQ